MPVLPEAEMKDSSTPCFGPLRKREILSSSPRGFQQVAPPPSIDVGATEQRQCPPVRSECPDHWPRGAGIQPPIVRAASTQTPSPGSLPTKAPGPGATLDGVLQRRGLQLGYFVERAQGKKQLCPSTRSTRRSQRQPDSLSSRRLKLKHYCCLMSTGAARVGYCL